MATSYYLCTSTQPISDETFCTGPGANLITLGVTRSYPQIDGYQVTGLQHETRYYFALQVADELDNLSGLATASARTLDIVPPDPVQNFQADAGSMVYSDVPVVAIDSSGAASESWDKTNAADGDPATAWSTPARATMQPEYLTVDTGAERGIGRIRLLSRDVLGALLPEELEIQVSNDNVNFATVLTSSITTPEANRWYTFTPPAPVWARYVKLLVTQSRLYAPNQMYYVQLAELAVDEASSEESVVSH